MAFALQARSDLAVYELLCGADVASCHRLHYLQMSFEKAAKAFFHDPHFAGSRPVELQTTHNVVAKVVPRVFQQAWVESGKRLSPERMKMVRLLCKEIDLLAPAVDDGGRRRDNTEYPWEQGDGHTVRVLVPCEHAFPAEGLLESPVGAHLLRVVKARLAAILGQA